MLAFSGCYYGGGDKERRELGKIRKRWKTLHVRLRALYLNLFYKNSILRHSNFFLSFLEEKLELRNENEFM